ncbi:MAG: CRTAC1 family protein [bacterium]
MLLLLTALNPFCWLGCTQPETKKTENAAANGVALPAFVEITAETGLGDFKYVNGAFGKVWFPEQMGAGCGFIDYNGDGWLDILLVGGGALAENTIPEPPALWLYHNNGDATFSLKTDAAGLGGIRAYGTGITVADYDNDGDEDFFFTTLRENMLFRNEGSVFSEVVKKAGIVADPIRWSSSSIFFDADKDGWLDLYVCNYADWSPERDIPCFVEGGIKEYCPPGMYVGVPNNYYHNDGDGTFTEMTDQAGFAAAPGKSLGIAEMDFNYDGWSDLVIANDGERTLLYENNRDGTFTEKGTVAGIAYSEFGEARAGMGIDAGVTDTTGRVSVFIGNFSGEMDGVYRYNENGWFVDRAAVSKIGRPSIPTLTFGVFLMDMDFDCDLDLFVVNGHVYPVRTRFMDGVTYEEPPQLFLNNNDGTFQEVSKTIGGVLVQAMVARGSAYGDFDRDGDPDILITENAGPAHLWRNDFKHPNFLRVQLQGRRSNRDAVGSRLVAVVGRQRMERRVRTGSSYLTHSEKAVTFGLGQAARVDSLIIFWPSDAVDRFSGIEGNQELLIVEGSGVFEQRPLPSKNSLTSQPAE